MKLPFFLTKKGLSLVGREREIAKLNYYNPNTFETEMKCLDLNFNSESLKGLDEYNIQKLDIELKYDKITPYEHDKKIKEITGKGLRPNELELELLEIDHKYNKVDNLTYERDKHELLNIPWAAYNMNYNEEEDPNNMTTQIVYNDCFIKKLKGTGYSGSSDDEIIEQWLKQVFASNVTVADLGLYDDEEEPQLKKNKNIRVG